MGIILIAVILLTVLRFIDMINDDGELSIDHPLLIILCILILMVIEMQIMLPSRDDIDNNSSAKIEQVVTNV